MGTKALVCSIFSHFHLERSFLTDRLPQLNALHHTARLWCAFTTQSMAIAYASSRQPKPKVRLILAVCSVIVDVFFFSLLTGDHIRLEFYGTRLTILATRMVARRFSLLPSHANGIDIMPQCPRAIPGCQVLWMDFSEYRPRTINDILVVHRLAVQRWHAHYELHG
jgi:hypothetical protein